MRLKGIGAIRCFSSSWGDERMGKFIDRTGERFGRLTVIERGPNIIRKEDKKPTITWWCLCDCGNEKLVRVNDLRNGHTQSCGCLHKESAMSTGLANKGQNRYEILDDVVVGYTSKNEPFYFDREDFELVSQYCWYKIRKGYICAHHGKSTISLHRLVMGAKPYEKIDHINHQMENACKSNLRVVSKSQNASNAQLSKANTSGVTGVSYDRRKGKWLAQLVHEGQHFQKKFGSFEEAVAARKAAEEKYFGEYSYDNSMAASPVIGVA